MPRRPQDHDVLLAFGARLRAVREASRLTQVALAERCKLKAATISLYESGDLAPSLTTLRGLARALGVEPAELLREQGAVTVPHPEGAQETDLLAHYRLLDAGDRARLLDIARRLVR